MALPTDIANLTCWLRGDASYAFKDAAKAVPVAADADLIWTLADQSGSSHDGVQATSGNRPVFGAVEGYAQQELSKVEFATVTLSALTPTAFSCFSIVEPATELEAYDGGGFNNIHIIQGFGTWGSLLYYGDSGVISFFDGTFHDTTIKVTCDRQLVGIVCGASSFTVYLNGQSQTIAYASATAANANFVVGGGTGGGLPMQGSWIDPVMLYTRAITLAEVNVLRAYAATRGVNFSAPLATVIVNGDSISFGNLDVACRSWPRLAKIPPTWSLRNQSQGSITLATLATNFASRVATVIPASGPTVITIFAGTNDIATGTTGAATYALLQSYCVAAKAASANVSVLVVTMLPRASIETQRQVYNSAIRTGFANGTLACDDIADVETIPMGVAGANTNTLWYAGDVLHPNTDGQRQLAAFIGPKIIALATRTTGVVPQLLTAQSTTLAAQSAQLTALQGGVNVASFASGLKDGSGLLKTSSCAINGNPWTPITPPLAVTLVNQGSTITYVTAIGSGQSTTYTGDVISGTLNYPFALNRIFGGVDLTGWTQVVFVAKAKQTDADATAIVTVKLSNPGAGSDGLTYLNGAAPSSPTTAADGSMTVTITPASGTVPVQSQITMNLTARGMGISTEQTLFWELAWYLAGVKQGRLDGGTFSVAPSVRANPVAS